ncbi:PAS domain-containing protein [Cupriavidus taiwanensis]|uniref:PAS domain-containing protein n=1 Tax=Cupriavidus taiwanensis TaxID=164546 RepID=UPI000E10A2DF|nr:PAS domain-containing protein [Cupriavidus taiwanensis]SOY66293.1 XRE family transcriptional regulator [Cupriavidus taiwanensis]SOY66296.1 XRE family transcriptional regulator [Cupriavidus taiwanensis]SOY94315.1 XRE family transcriptional regulator [Cupriavidus taiwanensis]SOZ70461.1 XRE family transcriptional regulator [Cupriavidus taiwanensis]SOZ86223.1 XRE family transcriptional regulator [Cupriavidus taiwanensis]
MTENSFAFRLKELLEHKKLTLQAVANALEVSRPAVHKWTRGGEIDYEKLRKLAAFLGVNWIWLRYGEQARQEAETSSAVEIPMTDMRRRYTAEIMESEARMKLAQEGARIVTWEWNLITDDVTYSSNVEAVYGWRIVSNESFWKHVHADDVPMMNAAYEESLQTGHAHEFDFRLYQPDGSIRWISSRATPVRELDGRIVKIVGISMDNTARKLAEQSLRDQQARFQAVFELTSEGIALLDGALRCESVNAALATMVGCDAGALLGEGLAGRFADAGARLRRITPARPKAEFSAELKRGDGSGLAVTVRATLNRSEDGASYYALALRLA